MNLMQIVEHSSDVKLSEWNTTQKILWIKLEELGLVKKNDYNIFLKFAAFFENFYKENHTFATVSDVRRGVGL